MWEPNRLMRQLGARDGWRCAYCERLLAHEPEHVEHHLITEYGTGEQVEAFRLADEAMEWPVTDHVIAKARGGDDGLDNRVLACAPCNCRKGTLPVEEFLLRFIGEA